MQKIKIRKSSDPKLNPIEVDAVSALEHTRAIFWLDRFGRVYNVGGGFTFSDEDIPDLFRFERLVSFYTGNPIKETDSLTDDGVRMLVKHPKISSLHFERCTKVTDDSIRAISSNKWIRWIGINCSKITDDAMERSPELGHLMKLGLYYTAVTEKSLEHLIKLRRLKYLFLNAENFSPESVDELRNHLPDCFIKTNAG